MSKNNFDTPILIIFWRRSTSLKIVLDSLRVIAPVQIFLASDGPREGNSLEAEQVAQARLLAEQTIDWPCEITKRYSDSNQGCKYGPANAITWFFSHVEEGIILEDDCLPHPSFFGYCENLLERYSDDQRIWHISGNNFLGDESPSDYSYFFSKFTFIWGWASWRRCWNQYDPEMQSWPLMKNGHLLKEVFASEEEWNYWSKRWDEVSIDHSVTAWAYQWMYACILNGGLAILPKSNLVENIGFGEGGVHTLNQDSPMANIPTQDIGQEIKHPSYILQDRQADHKLFSRVYAESQTPISIPRKFWLKTYFTFMGIAHRASQGIFG
jgi:hypothetical protein